MPTDLTWDQPPPGSPGHDLDTYGPTPGLPGTRPSLDPDEFPAARHDPDLDTYGPPPAPPPPPDPSRWGPYLKARRRFLAERLLLALIPPIFFAVLGGVGAWVFRDRQRRGYGTTAVNTTGMLASVTFAVTGSLLLIGAMVAVLITSTGSDATKRSPEIDFVPVTANETVIHWLPEINLARFPQVTNPAPILLPDAVPVNGSQPGRRVIPTVYSYDPVDGNPSVSHGCVHAALWADSVVFYAQEYADDAGIPRSSIGARVPLDGYEDVAVACMNGSPDWFQWVVQDTVIPPGFGDPTYRVSIFISRSTVTGPQTITSDGRVVAAPGSTRRPIPSITVIAVPA